MHTGKGELGREKGGGYHAGWVIFFPSLQIIKVSRAMGREARGERREGGEGKGKEIYYSVGNLPPYIPCLQTNIEGEGEPVYRRMRRN